MTGMKDPGSGELFRKAYSNREFKRILTRFLLLCVLVSLKARAYLRFSEERDEKSFELLGRVCLQQIEI